MRDISGREAVFSRILPNWGFPGEKGGFEELQVSVTYKFVVFEARVGLVFNDGAQLAGNGQAAVGRAHRGAVDIFAQVHQRQKSAENSGFKVVGERKAASGDARKSFAIFGDKAHDFALTLMRRVAESGFAAHGGAAGFQRQSEMQNADAMLG